MGTGKKVTLVKDGQTVEFDEVLEAQQIENYRMGGWAIVEGTDKTAAAAEVLEDKVSAEARAEAEKAAAQYAGLPTDAEKVLAASEAAGAAAAAKIGAASEKKDAKVREDALAKGEAALEKEDEERFQSFGDAKFGHKDSGQKKR